MSPEFLASYIILWMIVAVLMVLLILVYRHFGMMIIPPRSLVSLAGLDVGQEAPVVAVSTDGGNEEPFDWRFSSEQPALALFAMEGCPICKSLREPDSGLGHLPAQWPKTKFLWFDNEARPEEAAPHGWRTFVSDGLAAHNVMAVPAFPFAYVVKDGKIRAKGLINDSRDIEKLLRKLDAGNGGREAAIAPDQAPSRA